MSNRRNYYRILHVQPDAPDPVIRSSYRAMMQKLKLHPDLGGSHAEAAIINEAYAVLTDPVKRAVYDRELMRLHTKSALGGGRFHKRSGQASEGTAQESKPRCRQSSKAKQKPHCAFCKTPHSLRSQYETDASCSRCGSPLTRVTPMELEQSCRRAVMRVAKDEHVHIYTAWPQRHTPVRLQDISPNGMSFIASKPVAKAKIIKIASGRVHAVAEVMSCKRSASGSKAYSIGVRFLTLQFQQSTGTFVFEQV